MHDRPRTARIASQRGIEAASRPSRRAVLLGTSSLAAGVALRPMGLRAQDNFYAGKTIEFLSGYSEGAVSNLVMQEFAKALDRQLPETRVVMRPNAGGSTALTIEMLASAASDGLTVGSVSTPALLLGSDESRRMIDDFKIVASLNEFVLVIYASTASGITSLDALRDRDEPAILGVRATSSGSYTQTLFVNALYGTRIKPVTGYGSGARDLAFTNGEIDLVITSAEFGSRYIEDGLGVPLLKLSESDAGPLFAEVPGPEDLPFDPQFAWILDFFAAATPSSVIFAPRDVPPDRLAFLRDTFFDAATDPGFIADATPLFRIAASHGEVVQAIFDRLGDSTPDLHARVRAAVECGLRVAETGESCAL